PHHLHSFPTRRSSDLIYRLPRSPDIEDVVADLERIPVLPAEPEQQPSAKPSTGSWRELAALVVGVVAAVTIVAFALAPSKWNPEDRKSTRLNSSHQII